MKRILFSIIMAVVILSFVSPSWAEMVMGTLAKIDEKGSFYFVKDAKGKEHKIHFDDTTKKTGDVKEGVEVKVDEDKGHAKSIEVVEVKK
ncbi:MAG TPA: hypothetical protein VJM77_02685 [Nitrospiria bacterium]|nr:hypothetical protein [Nitrospiria bacterium]